MRIAFLLSGACLLAGCSRSNNLLLGRVQNTVAGHKVVVTDCYRARVPDPQQLPDAWRWTPCRDADIFVRGNQLEVNGKSYGKIDAANSILVDHGVVSVKNDGGGEK